MSEPLIVTIQREQIPWVQHNFPNREPWMPCMGLAEELGELCTALRLGDQEAQQDAIGDTAIFLCDFLTAFGINVGDCWEAKYDGEGEKDWPELVGLICHHCLKLKQGIRGTCKQHLVSITAYSAELLWTLIEEAGGEEKFEQLLKGTWDMVKQRDWAKARAEAGAA